MSLAITVQLCRSLDDQRYSRRQIGSLICLFCFSLALSSSVLAQTNGSAPRSAQAQDALDKGVIAVQAQDYVQAIRYFQDAHAKAPKDALILLDLGLAESRIPGRELRAIAWLEAYLSDTPQASNADAVKAQVSVLDAQYQSNLARLITVLQDQVRKTPAAFVPQEVYISAVAKLWTRAGNLDAALELAREYNSDDIWGEISFGQFQDADYNLDEFNSALRTADNIKNVSLRNATKIMEQNFLSNVYVVNGDMPSAQAILVQMIAERNQVDSTRYKSASFHISDTQSWMFNSQIWAGLLQDAQVTVDSVTPGEQQCSLLGILASEQALLGDIGKATQNITVARRGADCQQIRPDYKEACGSIATGLATIAEAQMNGGDTVGARNTIDLLPAGDERKSALEARLADAESRHRQGKAPIIHFTYKSLISKTPSKGLHPSPATSADWLRFVEGDKSELNTLPFLDLAAYLRTLPSRDDAKAYFATVEPTIEDMARLRKDVAKMLTIGIVR